MASLPLLAFSDTSQPSAGPSATNVDITAESWTTLTNESFLQEWRELAAHASEPNPFAESWFLHPALKAFDPSGDVQLIQFRKGGALCGLLAVHFSSSYYGYPIPHLRGWMHDNAFCGLPLVKTGEEAEFWRALFEFSGSLSSTGMFLHLAEVPQDGPLFSALADTVEVQQIPASIVLQTKRALLRSDLSAEHYLQASMNSKRRKELRRQSKRLSELGTVHLNRQSDQEGLEAWVAAFLSLEAAGWKGEEGSALASNSATTALFRDALLGAANAGKLERLSLTLHDKPIAMLANFLTPPGSYSFKTAFDEGYARFSPGVLLQWHNLDILSRKDIDWTDSCAAPNHPMIERVWREKRKIVRINIAIGGPLRRAGFRQLTRFETGATKIGGKL